jgi:hypothetical protein
MPTDYHQLEEKIQELQAEVDRMKAQEKKSKLPGSFDREEVLKFLSDPYNCGLDCAFDWFDTPQGDDYWNRIGDDAGDDENYKIPKKAKIQLLEWVVESYQQQYGA